MKKSQSQRAADNQAIAIATVSRKLSTEIDCVIDRLVGTSIIQPRDRAATRAAILADLIAPGDLQLTK